MLNGFPVLLDNGHGITTLLTDLNGEIDLSLTDSLIHLFPDTASLSRQFILNFQLDTLNGNCSSEFLGSFGFYFPCEPVSTSVEELLCPGDSVFLGGNWVYQPGTYGHNYQTKDGCDSSVVYSVKNSNLNTLAVPLYVTIEPQGIIPVFLGIPPSVLQSFTWSWTPSYALSCDDCPSPFLESDTAIVLHLTVSDSANCLQEFIFEARVELDNRVYIPNAFSPNDDGSNDFFRIFPKRPLHIDEMHIFNRWGDKVFELYDGHPTTAQWDGNFKGRRLNPQVFVYVNPCNF